MVVDVTVIVVVVADCAVTKDAGSEIRRKCAARARSVQCIVLAYGTKECTRVIMKRSTPYSLIQMS